jgi:ElaA protein
MTTSISHPCSRDLHWQYLSFAQLDAARLYALLQLRSAVFVVEQACVFQDMDGLDAQAIHLLGVANSQTNSHGFEGQLLAYARCFPAGVAYPEASIASVRGTGAGHALMTQALAQMQAQWGVQPVRIGAQAHLQGFYAQYGFVATGDCYLEDGIAHVQMLRGA